MASRSTHASIVRYLDDDDLGSAHRTALLNGLAQRPIAIPPMWFYDEHGSLLFEEITRLEEYYPTRTERSILETSSTAIVERAQPRSLVELGSGTCEKTRVLLDAMRDRGLLETIVPLDISSEMLERSVDELSSEYPGTEVVGVVADFSGGFDFLAEFPARLLAFLGSTIGNFRPDDRSRFLRDVAQSLGPDDWFLLGFDLVKDPARLVAAYDDAAGVTAAFNRNMLASLNYTFDANFDAQQFEHHAVWNPDSSSIEMRLRARSTMDVTLNVLGLELRIHAGEDLLTETCAKFTITGMASELSAAGLDVEQVFSDPDDDFALMLARRSPSESAPTT